MFKSIVNCEGKEFTSKERKTSKALIRSDHNKKSIVNCEEKKFTSDLIITKQNVNQL